MSNQAENPSREQIERRAYEIYLQRGGVDGSDVADWIMAEEELKASLKQSLAERTEHPQRAAQVDARNNTSHRMQSRPDANPRPVKDLQ